MHLNILKSLNGSIELVLRRSTDDPQEAVKLLLALRREDDTRGVTYELWPTEGPGVGLTKAQKRSLELAHSELAT